MDHLHVADDRVAERVAEVRGRQLLLGPRRLLRPQRRAPAVRDEHVVGAEVALILRRRRHRRRRRVEEPLEVGAVARRTFDRRLQRGVGVERDDEEQRALRIARAPAVAPQLRVKVVLARVLVLLDALARVADKLALNV